MAYINLEHGRTNSTDGRTKSTISVWCKRSKLSNANQYIWGWGENNSSDSYCRFDTADNIEMHCDGADGTFNSSELFRDTNGWYHIVFSLDGSNGTASLRRRFWINGVQMDEGKGSISTFSAAVQGDVATQDLWIGANPRSQQSGALSPFYGYISHFHYCDGYSYAATDFGEFDSNGVWKPKQTPSVSYGDNGIFLKMEDSSNMDLDSGTNNITLTTSGTVLSVVESPSNAMATFNPLAGSQGDTLSIGNTKFTSSSGWMWSPSTVMASKGKYYAEFKSAHGSDPIYIASGVVPFDSFDQIHNETIGAGSGGENKSVGYGHAGNVTKGNTTQYTGTSYGYDDVVCVAMDLDNHNVYFRKNGGSWENSGDPTSGSTGTGAVSLDSSLTWWSICTSATQSAYANYGNGFFGTTAISSEGTNASGIGKFEFDVPAGYTALSTKGLNN